MDKIEAIGGGVIACTDRKVIILPRRRTTTMRLAGLLLALLFHGGSPVELSPVDNQGCETVVDCWHQFFVLCGILLTVTRV